MSFRTNRRTHRVFHMVGSERFASEIQLKQYPEGSIAGAPRNKKTWVLTGMTIFPKLRGLGYGTRIYKEYENEVRRKGYDRIVLTPGGSRAWNFWKNQGYTPVEGSEIINGIPTDLEKKL